MVKSRSSRYELDMTEGNIVKQLLIFMVPLLLGNLFQQLYNTVDTWVLGNYATNEAFSAVGAVGPVVNMLIGAFMGFASGAGVVVSQYFGAGQYDELNKTVKTSLVMTLGMTVILTVAGVFFTPYLLRLMRIPEEVFQDAKDYLTIYFAGAVGLLFYNIGSGIMRAVGDSRRPFYFLVFCTLLNVGLDILFVAKFQLGVKGVAYATIIAQFLSAILTLATLMSPKGSSVSFKLEGQWCDWSILKQILRIGFPAAVQMAVVSFSNVFIQSYINYFGPNAISGFTVYNKLDVFIILPIMSMSLTATTFVGQNVGKNQPKRARKGAVTAFLLSMAMTVVLVAIALIFARPLISFFNPKPEVVEISTRLVWLITPFYFLPGINQVFSGALRGAGHSTAPMIASIVAFVGCRQLYMYIMSHFFSNTIYTMGFGYPVGWFIGAVIILTMFIRLDLGQKSVARSAVQE
jgi:putative MATE family efflux protein